MKSYLVTIETDHHYKLVPKCARGINEQLQKTSGADVLSSRKKPGGGGGWSPLSRPRVNRGIGMVNEKILFLKVTISNEYIYIYIYIFFFFIKSKN